MTNPTSHTTILKAHLEGMPSHTIGDEIWHERSTTRSAGRPRPPSSTCRHGCCS